jgi:hypothetical protein
MPYADTTVTSMTTDLTLPSSWEFALNAYLFIKQKLSREVLTLRDTEIRDQVSISVCL